MRLELGELRLAVLDLVRAELDVGLEHDLAFAQVVALECLALVAQPLLLEHRLRFSLAERFVLGKDARRLLLEVFLPGAELPLAVAELLVAGPPLLLPLCERPLATL